MNICVFGSSSERIDKIFLETAEHLGKTIAQKGFGMVYGAGKYGVMGASARGVTSQNGTLIGVTPKFFDEKNVIYDKCTELIKTETMRERKGIMEDRADAFVICAGGVGTFEEFFEVLTLKELSQLSKPIVIYNVNGYYNSMLALMENAVREQFITKGIYNLYSVAENEDELFYQIEHHTKFNYDKYDFIDKKES